MICAAESPLITIGITHYNATNTISECLASAMSQTWQKKEVVLVDDCSSDSERSELQAILKNFPQVKSIFLEKNQGVANARNVIINYANGEFLAFFDDDDISRPERLMQQYQAITACESKYNGPVVCHTSRLQIFPHATRVEVAPGIRFAVQGEDVVDRILFGRVSPGILGSAATCSQMARISVYREFMFDVSLIRSEDSDFIVRLGMNNGILVGVKEPLVTQQMTLGSEKTFFKEHQAFTQILLKNKEYLLRKGWFDFCLSWQNLKVELYSKNYLSACMIIGKLLLSSPVLFLKKFFWSIPATKTRASRNKFIESIS